MKRPGQHLTPTIRESPPTCWANSLQPRRPRSRPRWRPATICAKSYNAVDAGPVEPRVEGRAVRRALSDKARQAVTREIDRVRRRSPRGTAARLGCAAARRSILRPVVALAAIAASLLVLVGGSLVWYSLERQYRTRAVARSQVEMPALRSPPMASLPPAADGGAATAGERGWRFDRAAPPPGGSGPLTADYDFRTAASTSPVGVESAGPTAGAGTATSPGGPSPSGYASPGFMLGSESTSGTYGGRVADPSVQGVTESAGGNYQALDGPPMPGMPPQRSPKIRSFRSSRPRPRPRLGRRPLRTDHRERLPRSEKRPAFDVFDRRGYGVLLESPHVLDASTTPAAAGCGADRGTGQLLHLRLRPARRTTAVRGPRRSGRLPVGAATSAGADRHQRQGDRPQTSGRPATWCSCSTSRAR